MESPTAFEDPHIESPPTFEDPQIESPGTLENDDFGLTFEQEQTADELLADIQNAVDEMLQDFQTSPVTVNPPPVAPKKKRDIPQKKIPSSTRSNTVTPEQQVLIKSKNGGFGFQIMGGVDSDLQAQVDYIVPGTYRCTVIKLLVEGKLTCRAPCCPHRIVWKQECYCAVRQLAPSLLRKLRITKPNIHQRILDSLICASFIETFSV